MRILKNDDGSVDLYFDPEAPESFEKNWIKTIPGEGWFTLPRLYAPLKPIVGKTWRWNDNRAYQVISNKCTGIVPDDSQHSLHPWR